MKETTVRDVELHNNALKISFLYEAITSLRLERERLIEDIKRYRSEIIALSEQLNDANRVHVFKEIG